MEKREKKSKNWLTRLKYLKIRPRSSSCSRINYTNEDNLQRNLSSADNGNLSRHTFHFQRRNSFRKAITNMHNRMRNVFKHSRNNVNMINQNDFSVTPPHTNSRVSGS